MPWFLGGVQSVFEHGVYVFKVLFAYFRKQTLQGATSTCMDQRYIYIYICTYNIDVENIREQYKTLIYTRGKNLQSLPFHQS